MHNALNNYTPHTGNEIFWIPRFWQVCCLLREEC